MLDGPLGHSDVPSLCTRLHGLLSAGDADVVVCDVRALSADVVTVEALARLQLTARRLGRRISLARASPDLDRLVSFVGLADVLPACPGGGYGDRRHARRELGE